MRVRGFSEVCCRYPHTSFLFRYCSAHLQTHGADANQVLKVQKRAKKGTKGATTVYEYKVAVCSLKAVREKGAANMMPKV